MKSRLGLVQMNSRENFQENLVFVEEMLKQAATEKVDLLAFPETFLLLSPNEKDKFALAESLDGKLVQRFQDYARQYQLSILMGSMYEKTTDPSNRLSNTSVMIARDGTVQAAYRKIHLYDINAPQLKYQESRDIVAGKEAVVVDHEITKIGLTICYDLRFPGLYQYLAQHGAEIIFVPSAFFLQTGKDHWFPLLQARAIENQVYIAAPAQWGHHYGSRFSYGNTTVIDPWGKVIMNSSERTGLNIADIDLEYVKTLRQNMPVLEHRRYECYSI